MKGRNELKLCQAEMIEAMQQYLERTVMTKEYLAGAHVIDIRRDSGDPIWVIEISEKEKSP